ncbi:hypothetical protein ES708_01849 [subsurface metagenome]
MLMLISSVITWRSRSMSGGSNRELRNMSASTSSARGKWGWATLHQKTVSSLSVPALMIPPTPSIASEISLAVVRLGVPRKHRCSMKWETPACGSVSYLEPTPIKMQMDTERVWGMGVVITRRPLSRVVF